MGPDFFHALSFSLRSTRHSLRKYAPRLRCAACNFPRQGDPMGDTDLVWEPTKANPAPLREI